MVTGTSGVQTRAAGKTPAGALGQGLLKRQGKVYTEKVYTEKVYTEIVSDCRKATLQAIIRGRVALASVIHSDDWRCYGRPSGQGAG